MSEASAVEALFFAALERETAAERAAYLGEACGGDAELRRQVERLLRAHRRVGDFLGRPAAAHLGAGPGLSEFTEVLDGSAPGAGEDGALGILQPTARPDSLGRLGHYEVLEVLGRGGFGVVFRAFDEVLQRVVAVKVLAPQLAVTSPPRKRFLREARSSAKVRHEHVVQVYAVEEEPLPFLVMEFIPGETLQQRIDRTGPMEPAEVVRIGRQLAEGLAAAHGTGLVHRDIKPGNVLLEAGPLLRVKITDFGLARAADDASLSQSGIVAGTPLFMAPEQANGEAVDHRADLFSLGSVLYTMCTGRPPFRASSTLAVLKRVAEDTPRPIREVIPEVPAWLCDLIAKLHAKEPAGRYGSAQEVADVLAQRLAAVAHSEKVEAPRVVAPAVAEAGLTRPLRRPAPAARPRSRGRVWAAAAAVVLCLGGLGLAEATGVTRVRGTVIRLFSPEGTLVVEVDDPGVSVQVDGSDLVITGAGAKEIRLKPGRYTVQARKDGKLVRQELVTVTKNGREVVRVTQEGVAPGPKAPAEEAPGAKGGRATAAAWERAVSALPAVEQVKAVAARLQELNPGFAGPVTTTIEHGVVRGLQFQADHIIDLSPVRVLTGLRSLKCVGSDAFRGQLVDGAKGQLSIRAVDKSRLTDLSPLKGLPLTSLSVVNSNVYDLSPLRGMKLRSLQVGSTKVHDLSPLKGMPLEELDCAYTRVADLTPLQGMRLTQAGFGGAVTDLTPLKGMPLVRLIVGRGVTDLTPLKGMPLEELDFGGSGVSDLSPLKGMPLTILACGGTKVTDVTPLKGLKTLKRLYCSDLVSDLSPLKGLRLDYLHVGPLVTDLSPLKGMPLNKIELMGFKARRDAAILRAIPTLETINDKPAGQFWKEVDAGGKAP